MLFKIDTFTDYLISTQLTLAMDTIIATSWILECFAFFDHLTYFFTKGKIFKGGNLKKFSSVNFSRYVKICFGHVLSCSLCIWLSIKTLWNRKIAGNFKSSFQIFFDIPDDKGLFALNFSSKKLLIDTRNFDRWVL